MDVNVKTFWLPRKGNSPAEYEDAWAANAASGRFAVADGASEGCFTGLWARLLVEDFVGCASEGLETWPTSLSAIQERWDSDVRSRNLPYHAQPSLRRGAYAAFLGIALTNSTFPLAGDGQGVRAFRWQAVAVGDTCLFHTRGPALVRAFPLESSRQFSNAPKLIGARMAAEEIFCRFLVCSDGCGQPGDRLWLMTDALAQWCLAAEEGGESAWAEMELLLAEPQGGGQFADWIEALRSTRGLRNDDVTLLAIGLDNDS